MQRFGLESVQAGSEDAPLAESLKPLKGKAFVRARVDPMAVPCEVPSKLPSVQDTLTREEDYRRVMAFANDYGLLARGPCAPSLVLLPSSHVRCGASPCVATGRRYDRPLSFINHRRLRRSTHALRSTGIY